MELRCPVSTSSPSKAPSSFSPALIAHKTDNGFPNDIFSWSACPCGITRGRGLRNRPNNVATNTLLKQSSPRKSYFRTTRARREGLRNPHLEESLFKFGVANASKGWLGPRQGRSEDRIGVSPFMCKVKFDSEDVDEGQEAGIALDEEGGRWARGVGQIGCWMVTVVYVVWLFILPYAPGDPVWSISPSTIQMLVDLSLNFFFVLPLASSVTNAAGFDALSAPVLHPTAEALFNLVLGWTLLFAPLLFTDRKRNRFGGSLETLWIIQMFLTNTVLAPYMAIRLNSSPAKRDPKAPGLLAINLEVMSRGMTNGAYVIGITGATVGLISILWGFIGRPGGDFGGLGERWEYFLNYVGSERLAYAFLWDIALYTFFQPWLIGDNLENVRVESRESVQILRFVPYVGVVAYIIGLHIQHRPQGD
ncbi:unnamed protein product [Calypogeia fissa]